MPDHKCGDTGIVSAGTVRLIALSDIHYAGPLERLRGNDYEYRDVQPPLLRLLLKLHRRHLWLRDPLDKHYLLNRFLDQVTAFDYVIALGDYSCDSICVGLSDDAAFESARECLGKLRAKFGERLHGCLGDHELGKLSLVGKRGGMRVESFRRARVDLNLEPLWQLRLGRYVLVGVTSSLLALPSFAADILPAERAEWDALRQAHLDGLRELFTGLGASDRVVLFCHDPTALTFLAQEEPVRKRLAQIEATLIGHLHSELIWRLSRVLAGMPVITFLGHSARRLSAALREARYWRPFNVRLCPSLSGIELLKDGGYYTIELDPNGISGLRFQRHRLPR